MLVGKVYSLGRKEYGRLGMGDAAIDLAVPTPIPALQSQKCVEVAAGESVSLAVTESGKLTSSKYTRELCDQNLYFVFRNGVFVGYGHEWSIGPWA